MNQLFCTFYFDPYKSEHNLTKNSQEKNKKIKKKQEINIQKTNTAKKKIKNIKKNNKKRGEKTLATNSLETSFFFHMIKNIHCLATLRAMYTSDVKSSLALIFRK